MNTPLFLLILIPSILIGFVLIWSGVLWLLAWLSGWRQLARHYRCPTVPKGIPTSPLWAMLGPVSHRGTLTIHPTPEGLYLTMIIIFRVGHPSLLIPWAAVKRQAHDQGLFIQWVALDLGNPKITTLRLPAALVDEAVLTRYLGPV